MLRLSSCLFLLFNFLALICGFFAIGSYLYFQIHGVTDCKNVVQKPLMTLGIILIAVSLLGLVGIFCKFTCLLWFYSFVALLILVGLAAFAVVAYMVDNPSASKNLSGIGFKKHNLGEYSSQWLHNMVANGKHWKGIRRCLIDHQVCRRLDRTVIQKAEDFYFKKVSPIEYGCCKPPIDCGFKFKNATFWVVPKSGPPAKDSDCNTWSNKQDKLCFNCNSCKAGVVEKGRVTWTIFAILDFIDIALLLIIYTLSCCSRNHILTDRKFNRNRGYP